MDNDDLILIGVAPLNEAKRIQNILLENNIVIDFKYQDSTCKRGCTVTVELWANKNNLEEIHTFFSKERERLFDGLNFNPEVASSVFDTSSENATCPACGTSFSTKQNECPDCGLVFHMPEDEV